LVEEGTMQHRGKRAAARAYLRNAAGIKCKMSIHFQKTTTFFKFIIRFVVFVRDLIKDSISIILK